MLAIFFFIAFSGVVVCNSTLCQTQPVPIWFRLLVLCGLAKQQKQNISAILIVLTAILKTRVDKD